MSLRKRITIGLLFLGSILGRGQGSAEAQHPLDYERG
jgi:hypothetical protein